MVKLLLEAGAQKWVLDQAKMTPLHHACMHATKASEGCVRLLLGEKASTELERQEVGVNARDISGCTPLLYCLNNKNRVLEKVRGHKWRGRSGGPLPFLEEIVPTRIVEITIKT